MSTRTTEVPVTGGLRTPFNLSVALVVLMALQSTTGLTFPEHYGDVDWMRAAWFGNDWVTLTVALPLLVTGMLLSRRGSTRGLLLWLGLLGYSLYNYAFYLFGVELNAFFALYVILLVVAFAALLLTLMGTDLRALPPRFHPRTKVRPIGGFLAAVGLLLASVWFVMWGAYVVGDRPTPVEPEAFKVIAALDLTVMVPALVVGGTLLWRRATWGYVLAPIAALQGALYLLVLSAGSLVEVTRGLADAPGQLVVWAPLGLGVATAAGLLLAAVGTDDGAKRSPTGEPVRVGRPAR